MVLRVGGRRQGAAGWDFCSVAAAGGDRQPFSRLVGEAAGFTDGDESVGVKLVYDSAAGVKTGEFRPRDKPVIQTMEPGKSYNLEIRLSPSKFGLDRFVAGTITAIYSNAQSTSCSPFAPSNKFHLNGEPSHTWRMKSSHSTLNALS